jgi:hypothetical protein
MVGQRRAFLTANLSFPDPRVSVDLGHPTLGRLDLEAVGEERAGPRVIDGRAITAALAVARSWSARSWISGR